MQKAFGMQLSDIKRVVINVSVSKKDFSQKIAPLHSLPIPSGVAISWSVDHIILSRATTENDTAIIVFVDKFSKWPVIRLVKDTSAVQAAHAFIEGVVSVFGLNPNGQLTLNSDKGSAFTSAFFKEVCRLLNVRLITSGSQIPQSNGQAESCVKNVKQGLKMFADSDLHLKAAIPLIELSLRCQPHSATGISPFETIFGRKPCWPIILNEPANTTLNFKGDQLDYYNFISQRLKEIHEGVRVNLEESKLRDEQQYNARHKTKEPTWKISDEVLITDKKVKPHTDRILTRSHYHGSFYIVDVIENDNFGKSYKLVRTSDGRPLRHLISGSRLRLYTAPERAVFHAKYPKLPTTTKTPTQTELPANHGSMLQAQSEQNDETNEPNQTVSKVKKAPSLEPAIKILKERKKKGKTEYLVLFETKEKAWADKVSPALLRTFRIFQEQQRSKRRRRRKN
jgi:hypothetical protein